jgi:hypothetical protein
MRQPLCPGWLWLADGAVVIPNVTERATIPMSAVTLFVI